MDKIIINADDFGLNCSCTEAICCAFCQGLITDTTIVANGAAYHQAIMCITKYGLESQVGIHLNLTEGVPLTTGICSSPVFVTDGLFHGKVNRYKWLTRAERKAVYQELAAQIMKVQSDGISITHVDSHHHIHTSIFVAPIVIRVCKDYGIKKIRLHRNWGVKGFSKRIGKIIYNYILKLKGFSTTAYFGSMNDVFANGLANNLEIMVHPDFDKDRKLIDRQRRTNNEPVGPLLTLPSGEYVLNQYINV